MVNNPANYNLYIRTKDDKSINIETKTQKDLQ